MLLLQNWDSKLNSTNVRMSVTLGIEIPEKICSLFPHIDDHYYVRKSTLVMFIRRKHCAARTFGSTVVRIKDDVETLEIKPFSFTLS